MSNFTEHNEKIAFHPGYYLKEIVEESGLTQEDYAKKLGTTPKNLSILIHGDQSLSIEIATKLSRMLGTTVTYWLKLQQHYDEMQAQFISDEELTKEREVFKLIDYRYFRDNFHLPALPRKIDEQIKALREFLAISSLTLLTNIDLSASFRSYTNKLSKSNIVNSNVMVQIGVNDVSHIDAPQYSRVIFQKAVTEALTLTSDYKTALSKIRKSFCDAGVVLVTLPNLPNSGINGATKKVDGKILLMVNDKRHYADTFWFTLFHEIGHILHGDYGITFEDNSCESENEADTYARNALIPEKTYNKFISETSVYDETVIRKFAHKINRDPGIVYGRLQKDKIIPYTDTSLCNKLRRKYTVSIGL